MGTSDPKVIAKKSTTKAEARQYGNPQFLMHVSADGLVVLQSAKTIYTDPGLLSFVKAHANMLTTGSIPK